MTSSIVNGAVVQFMEAKIELYEIIEVKLSGHPKYNLLFKSYLKWANKTQTPLIKDPPQTSFTNLSEMKS